MSDETQTDQYGLPMTKMYTVEYIVLIDGEEMDETYYEIVWARDPHDAAYKAQEIFYESESIDGYSMAFKWVEVYENQSAMRNTEENER
jgi:flagellar biosynthesis regulator FlbT